MPNKILSVQEHIKYISTIRMVFYVPCFQLEQATNTQTTTKIYLSPETPFHKVQTTSIEFASLPEKRKDQI